MRLRLVAAEAGHELERRLDEADGDAEVDDLPPALGDADAQLAAAARTASGDFGQTLIDVEKRSFDCPAARDSILAT